LRPSTQGASDSRKLLALYPAGLPGVSDNPFRINDLNQMAYRQSRTGICGHLAAVIRTFILSTTEGPRISGEKVRRT
jgi:hypothetical protein